MVSKTELVEKLVEAGFSVVDAEKKVDQIYTTVKELKPKMEDYKKWELVATYVHALVQKTRRYGGKIFEGIVVAVDDLRDVYSGMKERAMKEYERDPNNAIANNFVRIDEATGNPIPIDWRETLRNGKKNPNYLQPLPTVYSRDVYMIVDDDFVIVRGEIREEPVVGRIYRFTGNRSGYIIRYVPLKRFEEVGVVSPYDLWDKVNTLLTEKGLLVKLIDLPDVDYGKTVAVKGNIIDKNERDRGSILTIEDFDDPTGMGVNVYCDGYADYNVGTEVIVIGVLTKRDGIPRIFAKGVIPNPRSDTGSTLSLDLFI